MAGSPTTAERMAAAPPAARSDSSETDKANGPDVPSGATAGSLLPKPSNIVPSNGEAGVKPEVAQEILKNIAEGKPPFKPELGKGGASWFVTEGNPYVGNTEGKDVTVKVEIKNPSGQPTVQFKEADLKSIRDSKLPDAKRLAEEQVRESAGKTNGEPLNAADRKKIDWNAKRIAETQMWDEVAERVGKSKGGVGEVELKNSEFSKADGKFALTTKPENVRLASGTAVELVKTLEAKGKPVEPGVLDAVKSVAAKEKWGAVEGAFRVGGKILVVVGAANDAYRIYTATDKAKTAVEVAGGWAGAFAAAGAYEAYMAPTNAAGPWAWLGNAAGGLIAGGAGYFAGSKAAEVIYEVTVEGKPITIGQ